MGVAVVAVVLVVGFLYTHNHPPSRFRQKRATGWNSYFHIAQWGFAFTMLGSAVVLAMMWTLDFAAWVVDLGFMLFGSDYRTPLWGTAIFTHSLPGHISIGTITSALFGAASAYGVAANKRDELEADQAALMAEYKLLAKSDGLEYLLFESMDKGLLILVTLKSRKVYIGLVKDPRLLHGDLENIVIIPMLSGYRDSDTLRFKISHNYRDYYEKYDISSNDGELRLQHFRTVIPTSEIDSASLFDLHTYQQFTEAEESTQ